MDVEEFYITQVQLIVTVLLEGAHTAFVYRQGIAMAQDYGILVQENGVIVQGSGLDTS